jgi:predicted Zn-ribbon and HTH transcriptional regulator
MTSNKEKLIDYLIDSNLTQLDSKKIQKLIAGLSATDILDALKEAHEIQNNLADTALGRVLL